MNVSTPAYIEAGPSSATSTLVFLHGIGGGKKGFQSSVNYFAEQGFRALAWDMPGYGDSQANSTLTFESLAASLEAMLDAAKVERAVLVGHSMGAWWHCKHGPIALRASRVWSWLPVALRLVSKMVIFKSSL